MICVQCVLHINCKLFNMKHTYRIKISFTQTDKEYERVKEIFGVKTFQKESVERKEKLTYNVSIVTEAEVNTNRIAEIMENNRFITSIELCDD